MARTTRNKSRSSPQKHKKSTEAKLTPKTAADNAKISSPRQTPGKGAVRPAAPAVHLEVAETDESDDPAYVESSSSEAEGDEPEAGKSDDEDIESSDIGADNLDDKAAEYEVDFDSEVEETRKYTIKEIAKTGNMRGVKSPGRLALVSFIDDVVIR